MYLINSFIVTTSTVPKKLNPDPLPCQQLRHRQCGFPPLQKPLPNALLLQGHRRGVLVRIIITQYFQEFPIPGGLGIGHNHPIDGLAFSTYSCQSHFNRHPLYRSPPEKNFSQIVTSNISLSTLKGEIAPPQGFYPPLGHALHHFSHFDVILQQTVDVLNRGATAPG